MVVAGLVDRHLVVKNTFLEVNCERTQGSGPRRRSSSECCLETDVSETTACCFDDEKLETASITTMDFENESLEDLSSVCELSSAASEDTSSTPDVTPDVRVPALSLNMMQAAAVGNPWLPMMQVIIVDSSKLPAAPTQTKSSRAQNRSRKSAGFDSVPAEDDHQKDLTTVMIRNLPVELSRDMLLKLLNDHGFEGEYNFVYMPIDFVKQVGLGYCFVNLVRNDVAPRFWRCFDRFRSWPVCSTKVCRLGWSTPHQGLQKHIERYRNSPLMHKDVPDEIRPALFENGMRIDFPPPTKAIHAPRLRASHKLSEFWKKAESA